MCGGRYLREETRQSQRKKHRMNAVLNILRGIVIGIANVIPGVSGGTMAVSMGIYDKLISAVTGLFKHFKKSMKLLIPLGVGMPASSIVRKKGSCKTRSQAAGCSMA